MSIDRSDGKKGPISESEQRIRNAAVHLFAARGYAATGIRDIARETGHTPASLYHYIGSKQELLFEIMRETMSDLTGSAREALAEADGIAEELAALARAHILSNGSRQLEAMVSDSEIRSLDAGNRARIVQLRDEYDNLWADVIRRGVEAGELHIAEQRFFRIAAIQMCNGISWWFSPDGEASLDHIADVHAEFVLRMAFGRESENLQGPKPPTRAARSNSEQP